MYAGGGEPDAPRDIGEGHALRALGIDRLRRGGENRVALGTKSLRAAFVALGYRLCHLHRDRSPASFRRKSSFLRTGEIGALERHGTRWRPEWRLVRKYGQDEGVSET